MAVLYVSLAVPLTADVCLAQLHQSTPGVGERCEVREISREQLTVEGGKRLYVEPKQITANSRGDAFLAGQLNYLMVDAEDGPIRERRDSIFGALVPFGGSPQIIKSPIPTARIIGVRVLARSDTTWEVVFGEIVPGEGLSRPDTVVGLWHGLYDGESWVGLEQITIPARVSDVRAVDGSALLRTQQGLAWAVPVRVPDHTGAVLLLERIDGEWTSQVADVGPAASVALARDAASPGYLLATISARAEPGGADQNSLFLFAERDDWTLVRRVSHGIAEPALSPEFFRYGNQLALTWIAEVDEPSGRRRELRAAADLHETPRAPVVVVDSSIGRHIPTVIDGGTGGRLLVSDHRSGSSSEAAIRITRVGPDGRMRSALFPNPFIHGLFVAAQVTDETVLLSGMQWLTVAPRPDDPPTELGRGSPATLLSRVRLSCP